MIFSADAGLLAIAAIGHVALWVAIVNRLHCTALPQWLVLGMTIGTAAACAIPLAWCGWLLWSHGYPPEGVVGGSLSFLQWGYLAICWAVAAVIVPARLHDRLFAAAPTILQSNHGERVDPRFADPPEFRPGIFARTLIALPGNQVLALERTEKTLCVPNLHPALDGLSVAHFSDVHLTGRIRKDYFQYAVRLINEMQPDLIAITGDLVEKSRCLSWVADVFGELRAPLGAYFVLGNHDRKVDLPTLIREMSAAGLVHLGGRWQTCEARGRRIVLAGNELPWLAPAADPAQRPSDPYEQVGLKLALAHSPDQIGWARSLEMDLLLAGHTHGGQVQFAKLGPVLSPSRYGVKYASGTFYEPPTVMHVSRGLSSETPLRFFCPPEITKLVLRKIDLADVRRVLGV